MNIRIMHGLLAGMAVSGLVFAADPTGPGLEIKGGGANNDTTVAPSGSGGPATTTDIGTSGATITGKVESIDKKGSHIWIRDSSSQVNKYKINDNTRFTRNGKHVKFSDLKSGDTISFDQTKIAP